MANIFLDAQGGELAFFKEGESPDWSSSVYRDLAQGDIPESEPTSTGDAEAIDVSEERTAVILLKPSDSTASYDFKIYAGMASNNIDGFYPMMGKGRAGLEGKVAISANVKELDELFVGIESLSSGSIEIEYAKVPINQ